MQLTATAHRSTLQHMLQLADISLADISMADISLSATYVAATYVAVCCGVLQHMLQCAAVCCSSDFDISLFANNRHILVCGCEYSVLQCVAVCCSVLQ